MGEAVEYVSSWITDDEHEYVVPGVADPENNHDLNTNGFCEWHKYVKHTINDTRWAVAGYQGTVLSRDHRMVELVGFPKIAPPYPWEKTEAAMFIIMDDIETLFFNVQQSVTETHEDGSMSESESYMGKWIHYPQTAWSYPPPNLEPSDHSRLLEWMAQFPNFGAYIYTGATLVSQNPGANTDIQEKYPPEGEPKLVSPDFDGTVQEGPKGQYIYLNDRNTPVRYDRAVNWDERWNNDCSNVVPSMRNDLLLGAAGIKHCSGDPDNLDLYGTEAYGVKRWRYVVPFNGSIAVIDPQHGRTDFSVDSFNKLR
jgi:hypothetical protein